jgi:hypothetical protein
LQHCTYRLPRIGAAERGGAARTYHCRSPCGHFSLEARSSAEARSWLVRTGPGGLETLWSVRSALSCKSVVSARDALNISRVLARSQ